MKKTLLISLLVILAAITGFSQAPNAFKYQAVLRNIQGEVLVDTPVDIRITIMKDGRVPINIYIETHSITTNQLGLIHLDIGNGTPEFGSMEDIEWSENEHFCQIEIDDGNGFIDMGMKRFMSVPYALHAKEAESISGMLEADSIRITKKLYVGDGSLVVAPHHFDCMPTGSIHYNLWTNLPDQDLFIQAYNPSNPTWIGGNIHENNTIINNQGGNVGIGTCHPQAKLDLELPIQAPGLTGGAAEIGSENNDATGDYALALGYMNTASGWAAVAMGNGNQSLGWASTTMNTGNTASGEGSTAMGVESHASGEYSTATGEMTLASGRSSIAMGLSTISSPKACAVVGSNNIDNGTTGDWVLTEPVFIVGNGDPTLPTIIRNNAMTILKNGKTGLNTDMPTHLLHINNKTNPQADPLRVETLQMDDSDSLLIITGMGVVKWRDAATLSTGGQDMDWEVSGNNVLTTHGVSGYPTGNVGIGTIDPQSLLSVGTAGESKTGLYVYNDATVHLATGITGEVATPINGGEHAFGVYGKVESGVGWAYGVKGEAINSIPVQTGRSYGVYGRGGNATDMFNYGVMGDIDGQNSGAGVVGVDRVNNSWDGSIQGGTWAGYFYGRTYVKEELGVNTTNPVTTFDLNGGMALKVSILTPGFIDHTDRVVLCNDAGDYYLPSAVTFPGLIITIKNIFIQGDAHIYPDPNTSEQIEANIWGNFIVLEPMDSKTIISDGDNWWIISRN